MEDLVFVESSNLYEEPYTTSEVIANCGEVDLETVHHLIREYQNDLEEFGLLGFEIRKPENGIGRPEKIFHLNEQQSTLLITYMRNTKTVRKFKKALTKQFYIMRDELSKRVITREVSKQARKALTDVIKEQKLDFDNRWIYKSFSDLIYKHVLGMDARHYQAKYEIPNGKLRDFLTIEQIHKLEKTEDLVKALIAFGYDYQQIKEFLAQKEALN